jgi:hypothetical protein
MAKKGLNQFQEVLMAGEMNTYQKVIDYFREP